jgi:predicted metal-dependent hydrolase
VADAREPQLSAEERAALRKGVAEFNAGLYFECHDTLEDLWAGIRGPSRDFFQGLIQVSVGYYHLGNDNAAGAASMFERALRRLEKYPPRYYGFDVAAQRGELERLTSPVGSSAPSTLDRPRWAFETMEGDTA